MLPLLPKTLESPKSAILASNLSLRSMLPSSHLCEWWVACNQNASTPILHSRLNTENFFILDTFAYLVQRVDIWRRWWGLHYCCSPTLLPNNLLFQSKAIQIIVIHECHARHVPKRTLARFPLDINSKTRAVFFSSAQYPTNWTKFLWWTRVSVVPKELNR